MTRGEFITEYAAKYNRTKTLSKAVCKEVFNFLRECLEEHDRIYIKGLGTFKREVHKVRRRYDFRTKQIVEPSEVTRLAFVLTDPIDFENDNDEDDEE